MGNRAPKLTLQEQFQIVKRQINKSIREIDRERNRLEQEEKAVKVNIRKAAENGNMTLVKSQAKDLVKLRNHTGKFMQMRSNLQSVQLKLQTVKSTHAMSQSLSTIPKLMTAMNKELDIPKLNQIMKQFMVESEKLGITQDFMEDIVEGVADAGVNDLEVEEEIVNQVLDEVGIDLSSKLSTAPQPAPSSQQANAIREHPEALLDGTENDPNAVKAAAALEQSLEERLRQL